MTSFRSTFALIRTHLPCHRPPSRTVCRPMGNPAGLRSLVERDYRTIPVVEGGQGASAMCSSQIMSDWLRDE